MVKRKISILSIVLFVFAGLLALYAIWSIVNIHSYIALQQVPFSGNEYTIINYYMANAGQYVVYAIISFSLGWLLQKFSPITENATPEFGDQETVQYETVNAAAEEDKVEEDSVNDLDSLEK